MAVLGAGPVGLAAAAHLVDYLEPLAATPQLAPSLRLNAKVLGVARAGIDKLKDGGRDEAPFESLVEEGGIERRYLASAVIDASGTWRCPNPLGAGLPASGEAALRDRIAYGIPDVLGQARGRFAGKRVVVVGSGHSAFNVILDLVAMRESSVPPHGVDELAHPDAGIYVVGMKSYGRADVPAADGLRAGPLGRRGARR